MTDLPEAPVVMFTNYQRKDGFQVSLTLRGNVLADVATEFNTTVENIIKAEGKPLSLGRGGFSGQPGQTGQSSQPVVPTKPCPIHNVEMREKTSKNGSKFFSHSRGQYPNLEYCNGEGFPSDKQGGTVNGNNPY